MITEKQMKYYLGLYNSIKAQLEILKCVDCSKKEVSGEFVLLTRRLEILDACLKSLNDRERFLIDSHVIKHNTWDSTSRHLEEKWGNWNSRSLRTLKRIQKAALNKMATLVNAADADELFY